MLISGPLVVLHWHIVSTQGAHKKFQSIDAKREICRATLVVHTSLCTEPSFLRNGSSICKEPPRSHHCMPPT